MLSDVVSMISLPILRLSPGEDVAKRSIDQKRGIPP